jgi:O-antigen/teichoic acid export membrane protein
VSTLLAKNTLYLTLAAVGQKMIAFVYFLFLARIMEPEATGAYFLAISIATMFSVVADFGITPVIIREIAKRPYEAVQQLQIALGTKLPFIALALIGTLGVGYALHYDPSIIFLISLAALVLFLDSIHLLYYGALRGVQKLKYEALGMFLGQGISALAGGLVLWLHPSLPWLILALATGSFVNVFVSISRSIKYFGPDILKPLWNSCQVVFLLKAALPFALAAIFVKVYSYVDSIFISKLIDTTAVGIYSIAYKFTYAFQFLPLAFVAALYPGLSALVGKNPKGLEQTFMKSMWYMMILAVPITFGIWLIAPEMVLLAGDGYRASAPVLRVLVLVLIPIFLDFPIGSLLNASGRQATKTAIMGVTMLINIVLNALLIPQFQILGAAYAGLASFIFMYLAGLYFIPQMIPSFSYWKMIKRLSPIFLSGAVMLLVGLYLKPLTGWVMLIPLSAMVYLIGLSLTRSFTRLDLLEIYRLIAR